MSVSDLPTLGSQPLTVSWFATARPEGPALGDPEQTTWDAFASCFWWRREGEKDGPAFVPARFRLEPDGRHVRRLGANLIARTAVAMDCETDKKTGAAPPSLDDAVARIGNAGLASVIYTSHHHTAAKPRYRIVLALSGEIDHELPAVEVVAELLGLASVIDRSKLGAASLFYLPSCPPGALDRHRAEVITGTAIDAAWIRAAAGKLLTELHAEQDRIAAVARAEAEARRQAKVAAGYDADDSLIEKVRAHLDLEHVLLTHGYDKRGTRFRHPRSTSGTYGASIKAFAGIERVYSHSANDPLHRDNLPAWCATVTALDVFDAVAILDFKGDRNKALRELAVRYGLTKTQERKAVARLLFRLIREHATQEDIKTAAYAEGARLGLTVAEVCEVARWVATERKAA